MDVLLEETQGKKVFVVAGEVSGDALAAHVLRHHTCIEGVIGQNLKDIGAKEFLPIDVFQTLGFFSVLRRLPHFIHLFFKLRNHILSTNPDLVLLVDNAEFSLLLGKSLRKHGYKGRLVQLVAPSVWAWRRHRAKIIDTYFDQVLCILPFEPDYFKNGV